MVQLTAEALRQAMANWQRIRVGITASFGETNREGVYFLKNSRPILCLATAGFVRGFARLHGEIEILRTDTAGGHQWDTFSSDVYL